MAYNPKINSNFPPITFDHFSPEEMIAFPDEGKEEVGKREAKKDFYLPEQKELRLAVRPLGAELTRPNDWVDKGVDTGMFGNRSPIHVWSKKFQDPNHPEKILVAMKGQMDNLTLTPEQVMGGLLDVDFITGSGMTFVADCKIFGTPPNLSDIKVGTKVTMFRRLDFPALILNDRVYIVDLEVTKKDSDSIEIHYNLNCKGDSGVACSQEMNSELHQYPNAVYTRRNEGVYRYFKAKNGTWSFVWEGMATAGGFIDKINSTSYFAVSIRQLVTLVLAKWHLPAVKSP